MGGDLFCTQRHAAVNRYLVDIAFVVIGFGNCAVAKRAEEPITVWCGTQRLINCSGGLDSTAIVAALARADCLPFGTGTEAPVESATFPWRAWSS